ncbi:MAG: hypothetical protein SVX43_01050 [Cyanobacteriota bacterium]|nr:hypothetical protein [Cyanobacteriota bacterium]
MSTLFYRPALWQNPSSRRVASRTKTILLFSCPRSPRSPEREEITMLDPTPILTCDRLSLSPITEAETEELHRLWIEPAVRKHLWDDCIVPRDRVRGGERDSPSSVLFGSR